MRNLLVIGLALLLGLVVVVASLRVQQYKEQTKQSYEKEKQLEQRVRELEETLEKERRVGLLRRYFENKNAPMADFSGTIISVADRYGVDPSLVAAVSMAESTGCKNYIRSTYNCFGWGSGLIKFTSHDHSIEHVVRQIGTSPRYRDYQNKKTIRSFAKIYNNPYWQDYEKKLTYFVKEIENYGKIN